MRFFRSFSRVYCDLAVTATLCAGAKLCEGALAKDSDVPTLASAVMTTLTEESTVIYHVLVDLGYGSYAGVVLSRGGSCIPIFEALQQRFAGDRFVTLNGKPIHPHTRVDDLEIAHGTTFKAMGRLRGGSKVPQIVLHENYFSRNNGLGRVPEKDGVRTSFVVGLGARTQLPWCVPFGDRAKAFSYLKEYYDDRDFVLSGSSDSGRDSKREFARLGNTQRLQKKMRARNFDLQSEFIDPRSFLQQHTDVEMVSFIEDVILLCLQLLRARNHGDRALAVTVFVKLRSGGSLLAGVAGVLSDVMTDIFDHQLQSSDDVLEAVTDVRSLISNWESVQQSALVQQILKVYKYAIAMGVFSLIGVKIDEKVAYACRKEMSSPLMGVNFVTTIVDTVSLFIQRALLFQKTGSWEVLIHGPTSFGKWYDACQKVKREFQFRGDLEAQGTNYHTFVSDLKRCIEEGRSILKFGQKTTGLEIANIKRQLNELLMMQADLTTFREAQKSRRPPFGLLVHGKTCVGKSTFTSMLFHFAGKVWKLPTSDEFKYTRNTCDDFWSGWDSMKWFLLLDDIAFTEPNGKIVDNSLNEVIQIMNDVPLVPNQASLEDKGKNPMRARMCVATTNTKHLNAFAYFACPIAVQRRFPFVLTVTPKLCYARDDDPEMIDPAKLPPIVDDWPDFWNITVERVVAEGANMAKYQVVAEFTSSTMFLQWLAQTMQMFETIQQRAGAGIDAMRSLSLCEGCHMVESKCVCDLVDNYRLQAREYALPSDIVLGEPFTREDVEDDIVWKYEYVPHVSGDCNYMLRTTITKGDVIVRSFVSPVRVVKKGDVEIQSDDIAMAEVLAEIVSRQSMLQSSRSTKVIHWIVGKYLGLYTRFKTVRNVTHSVMEWSIARKVVLKSFQWYTSDSVEYYRWLGDMTSACYLSRKWKYILGGLAALSTLVVTYGLYQSRTSCVPQTQGLRQSVPDDTFPVTERMNVWKRDDYETSTFDRSELSVSFASLPFDQLMRIVERNTARIKVSNGVIAREGNVFSPCGHLWMTNNHTLMADSELVVSLSVMPHVQGASPNVTFKLRQEDILRIPERDLAFFEVYSWETKRDLRGMIRKASLKGAYTATYVTRDKQISTKQTRVKCVTPVNLHVQELGTTLDMWSGYASEATVVGDCGSPLVVHQPIATILGIHTLGNASGMVWATSIDEEVVEFAVKHFAMPVVQCSHPIIGAPSRPKSLGALRQRSPLRWLESGSLTVYGSYVGHSVTSRSKVKPTLLAAQILEQRKWDVPFTAPQLRDWRPWRLALIDSTQKQFGALSASCMKQIAQAYADDVCSGLTADTLAILEPLSERATINGIDGVRFIDKMNFKSSMGEPYNKSKKFFLAGEEGEKYFNDEVKGRIELIEERYARGERACPVFSGQLKDEARAKVKVEQGKIRVFTAAPADWSFVVRKYLLPFVKIMQEHPFLFEASPGCTVQSLEWQQYYQHLTHFGVDRMVCGDYGKFDKKMEALIIVLAFQVIRKVYSKAGWTDDQMVVIDCIAEDTAYAFVNFDGDLVEFFGSNPSGHPLTVIINCIVNALYMRYAFVELCPFSGTVYDKARRFKEFVRLLTYGDDNVMNVSPQAEWFNHTAIQKSMSNIGVEYTMADKESHSRPFIHIREVSYLKRSWRWDEDIGAVVCPLEEMSIHKMLTICNPSGTESAELHMASVMSSALNEWFWYGRSKFEEEREWLFKLATDNNLLLELKHKGFPEYDELRERFWAASKHITCAPFGCEAEHPRNILPN